MKKVVVCCLSVLVPLLASPVLAIDIFQDDFSAGLAKWDPQYGDGSSFAGTTSSDGLPAPAALVDDYLTNGVYLQAKTGPIDYVGKRITVAADAKHASAGWGQMTTGLYLWNWDCWWASPIAMGVHGSQNGQVPNTLSVAVVYGPSSGELESATIPVPTGDGWHRQAFTIRNSGIVDFYWDNVLVYTSTHAVESTYATGYVWIGGRKSYYDNVVITPEPATLLCLTLGGLITVVRKK